MSRVPCIAELIGICFWAASAASDRHDPHHLAADKIRVIGNASLGGASLMLQSDSAAAVEQLRAQCRIIELNQIESFEDHFIDCMPLEII